MLPRAIVLMFALPLAALSAVAGTTDCGPTSKTCAQTHDPILALEPVEVVGLSAPPRGGSSIPCADPRGCPDLFVDPARMRDAFIATQTFSPTTCSVQEGHTQAGLRRLLRFTFATPNIGSGDLVVGAPSAHPEWFEFAPCHNHYHFRQYADYRLWTPQGYAQWQQTRVENPDATAQDVFAQHPELLDQFIAGNKQGFCVIDLMVYVPFSPFHYTSCGGNQGISRGWADVYVWGLDGQWIDITGVAPGVYVLEAEVNAERLYVETDYANNGSALAVRIP